MKPSPVETKFLALLDRYLADCKTPPFSIPVHPKQHASLVTSRNRNPGALDTSDYLKFTNYKCIPIVIIEEKNQ